MIADTFWEGYARLPAEIREQARKCYQLWKDDPSHPSLRFKRIGIRTESYSVRVGKGWRAVGVKSGETLIWFWIGSHAGYDELAKGL
jgi:hypothetical protein